MAVRSDGEGRMKNMNEESERRECRWLETSVSYKSFNMWETGLNVSVEVIRKKGKGEMYNRLNSLIHVFKTSWPMRLQGMPDFQNAEEKNSMLYNYSVLKH